MRCQKVRERLSAYLDGELEDAARREVERHLAGCESCRETYAELEQVHALLVRAERSEGSPALAWRVAAATRRRRAAAWRPVFPLVGAGARALALAVAVVIGAASGGLLAGGQPQRSADAGSLFSLDLFAAAPPDSPGGAYLALLEAADE